MNINNTLFGIWLPMAAGAQAFQIIVLRTFFASLPQELFEAGRIDGASELRMLVQIALPLSKPILLTLIVLQVMGVWNEFIWPIMVLSNPDRYPIILGVLRLSQLITARDPGAHLRRLRHRRPAHLHPVHLHQPRLHPRPTSGAIKM